LTASQAAKSASYWKAKREAEKEEADARSYAAKYRTDDVRWPNRGDVRRIALDFHGVIQVKADRGGWYIPALHLELIRGLQDNNWRVFVISWVGSNKRRHSTWAEMGEGGLIDGVGAESIMIVDPHNDGQRRVKAAQCEGNRIGAMIDDLPEVVTACVEKNIVGIAIRGHQEFPEGIEVYSNLKQALRLEGILIKRETQDR
jgi:hypothetical protein